MNTNLKEEKSVKLSKDTKEWLNALLVQTIESSYTSSDDVLSAVTIFDFIRGAYEIAKDIMMSCDEDNEDEEEQIRLNQFVQIVGELEEYI